MTAQPLNVDVQYVGVRQLFVTSQLPDLGLLLHIGPCRLEVLGSSRQITIDASVLPAASSQTTWATTRATHIVHKVLFARLSLCHCL